MDHVGRSLKAQFKYANKLGARFVGTIGEEELIGGQLRLKEMETGEEEECSIRSNSRLFEYEEELKWLNLWAT